MGSSEFKYFILKSFDFIYSGETEVALFRLNGFKRNNTFWFYIQVKYRFWPFWITWTDISYSNKQDALAEIEQIKLENSK